MPLLSRALVPAYFSAILAAASLHAAGPAIFNTERNTNGPMSAAEVVAKTVLPPGFRMTVFASEPDLQQPIALTTDPRGRVWVAENYSYSEVPLRYHPELRDRIVLFEDSDNDGHFDKRSVFWDNAQRLMSVEVGLGGVWALALPNLVFIPDKDGDGIADGPPQVVLDGFEYKTGGHTVANGLRWGPDGWLYGRHGIQSTSRVGAPGTPPEQRVSMNVGIWRYHPGRRIFEVVTQGTTNPWGMDWNARGEPFFINTVIGHLWHVIPGAHYRRMYGDDPSPHTYQVIEQTADHVHWATGESWTDVRKGVSDVTLAAGGGHAHTGLMIYQGGVWPEIWKEKLLTINFHGRRLNVETLERKGSGYVAHHNPDAFLFADPWFRGIDLIPAPDGNVFVSDWTDAGECHDNDGIHRTSGRIYKLIYENAKSTVPTDLTKSSDLELARLQTSPNDWMSRSARRVLADRAKTGSVSLEAINALRELVQTGPDEVVRLRSMWALHLVSDIEPVIFQKARARTESERAWALRLMEDARFRKPANQDGFNSFVAEKLPGLATSDDSALVRGTLASLLQKLSNQQRLPIAKALLAHGEDANDHNIPLLLWYGIDALAPSDPSFMEMLAAARIPRTQRLGARRLAEDIDSAPQRVDTLLIELTKNNSLASRQAVLDGLADGFGGRRKVPRPPSWIEAAAKFGEGADDRLSARIRDLSALFGDGRALDQIREVALNEIADMPHRRSALQTLIDARAPGLREVCEKLLPIRDLSPIAATGLAVFEDNAVADTIIKEWPNFYGHERPPILTALMSRPVWISRFLDAMGRGQVKRQDLGVAQARQILQLNNPALTRKLTDIWGALRDTDEATKRQALDLWRKKLTPEAVGRGNLNEGRSLFNLSCGTCHKLYGEGAALGPDLTGSGRQNLEYLLENILFPSAIVPADYRQTTLTLRDGRVLNGVIRGRTTQSIALAMVGDTATIGRDDLAKEEISNLSLMPEGLIDNLTESQVRDLFAYLMSTAPPAKAERR